MGLGVSLKAASLAILVWGQPLLPPPPREPANPSPTRTFEWTCTEARITGYVRTAPYFNPTTADGTPITTQESIVAASYDVPLQSVVEIEGLGTFRVADRGRLEETHIDVAVWSTEEAYEITGRRNICWRPPTTDE